MGIESTSIDYARANILDEVGVAMLSNSLKDVNMEAKNLLEMIESAVPLPAKVGTKIDLRA